MLIIFRLLICSLFLSTPLITLENASIEKKFLSNGSQIYYKKIGTETPLIIIHGGPGHNSSYFLPQFEKLSQYHQLIFYDQRGSGHSEKDLDFDTVTMEQFVADLENLREELNLDHFQLLGHAWGALIALQYAAKYPHHVDKLVLMNPFPTSAQDLSSFALEVEDRLKQTKNPALKFAQSEDLLVADVDTFKNFYSNLLKTFLYDENNISELKFEIGQQDALQGLLIYRIFEESFLKGGYDYKPYLKKIDCPTLVIHGDSDPIPTWTAKETTSYLKNGKCRILKDCGHFPHIEKPDELFDELSLFLNLPQK